MPSGTYGHLHVSDRAAVVLAGGFATRFEDGDKTLARLDGRPLLVHACEPLAAIGAEVVVSCRREQIDTFEGILTDAGLEQVELCPDERPDRGPLAGLGDALGCLSAEAVAVATADMPCLPAGLWTKLFDTLDGIEGVVTVEDGYRQPAPSVCRTARLRERVASLLAAGDARLSAAFEGLDVRTVPAGRVRREWGEHVLTDVNTRSALERLRSIE